MSCGINVNLVCLLLGKTNNGGTDKDRTPESVANYYQEWKEIMDLCIREVCRTTEEFGR